VEIVEAVVLLTEEERVEVVEAVVAVDLCEELIM